MTIIQCLLLFSAFTYQAAAQKPTKPTPSCKENEFDCQNPEKINGVEQPTCIPYEFKCDGNNDCKNQLDEKNCEEYSTIHVCQKGNFICNDGELCVCKESICDGEYDCVDGSDENHCPVSCNEISIGNEEDTEIKEKENKNAIEDPQLKCDDVCLCHDAVCDGITDCKDKTDEQNCLCDKSTFACFNKIQCVCPELACDGENDCIDGSDEYNCPTVCNKDTPDTCPGKPPAIKLKQSVLSLFIKKNAMVCSDHLQCVCNDEKCNGVDDCRDKTDESCGFKCPDKHMFMCKSRSQCICKKFFCDGKPDCSDGSDELKCGSVCAIGKFQCHSDQLCVCSELVCDGKYDCMDGSDETTCKFQCSGPESFRCKNSAFCICSSLVCDGKNDCSDGSDEEGCITNQCGNANEFKCDLLPQCVCNNYICDTKYDCLDKTDESLCSETDRKQETGSKLKTGNWEAYGNAMKQCMSKDYMCDHWQDCIDALDENECNRPAMFYAADDGKFLDCSPLISSTKYVHFQQWKCDAELDCTDGSDEHKCTVCNQNETECWKKGTNQCGKKCDGVKDCADGLDEADCA